MLDNKQFPCHVDYLHSEAIKLLGLVRFINFSSLDSLRILLIITIRRKLEYISVVWNNLTLADSNYLQDIENLQMY
jgi:hypothetical protein